MDSIVQLMTLRSTKLFRPISVQQAIFVNKEVETLQGNVHLDTTVKLGSFYQNSAKLEHLQKL